MHVALVSTYTHPFALGLRYISSCLKTAGHRVTVLFMSSRRDTARPDYTPAALDDFVARLWDCDLIGLSLMTNSFHRACLLTRRIREAGLRTPIVWGGIHPTVLPEECLEHADIVCVGEGEEAMLRLVEHLEADRDPLGLPNLWFRADGPFRNATTVRNPPGPLITRLDDLPPPDYELDTHWVAARHGLEPARPGNLRGALETLRVVTARGCPYHCAFCNNAALRNVYGARGRWVRLRSLENVLAELRHARACFPMIRAVNFVDDLFLVRTEAELEEFAARYRAEVNLPLQLDAFPNTVTEGKVRALARLPIELVSMGIESASEDTLRNIYRRPTPPRRIAEAIALLARYRLRAEYHYIVSNPYEPEQNVIETMRFIATHHRGRAVLRVFPLMFYPGTPLYERARADGRLGVRDDAAYDYMGTGALQFARHDYLAIWLRIVLNLRNLGVPPSLCHRVIDIVTHPTVRRGLDRPWFAPAVFLTYQVTRKIARNFVYQPFVRPFKYLRRPRRPGLAASRPWRLSHAGLAGSLVPAPMEAQAEGATSSAVRSATA